MSEPYSAAAQPRPLHVIAREIIGDWTTPYFGAVPYIEAMRHLVSLDSTYGRESGREVVARFLVNAAHWRGPAARAVKAELKQMIAR